MRNDILLNEMGKQIKSVRKANKLSLTQLSKLCGVDISNLWFIENARRNVDILTLKSIADVFNMDIKELL